VDPLYEASRSKARAAGLLWGAYHFGTGGDGIVQAEHLLPLRTAWPGYRVSASFRTSWSRPTLTYRK
jgi:lysozyme